VAVKAYLIRLLVSVDQFLNTLCLGNPDETISSRVGKAAERGSRWGIAAEGLIDCVFALLGQRDHCRAVIERDEL
jgi:hypothetical protein